MSEHFDESNDEKIDCKGKYVSVMIEYGHRHSYINGIFLGETCEHLIVKDNKNKVIYINKNKIICHTFEKG
ncbi:hypothetical protein [Clostridium ljungdahlii]|uniref:Uncharacterized protein n=1 Tax=Clostridium ljungdahlii TaxID=1538 RepID=A0A166R9J4_9CLOT|nr:hypothetical protein [Clostridium ljungdahlii]OAA90650.1 hypothetical protein WY13_01554 [Clostridium ljungdahlii]